MEKYKSKLFEIIKNIKHSYLLLTNIKINKKLLFIVVPICTVVLFFIVLYLFGIFHINFQPLDTNYMLLKSQYSPDLNIRVPEIPEVKDHTNPLNGDLITKSRRDELDNKKVFGVTVNNFNKARPQSGLSDADIVMEVLTEGGITRYVALFYGHQPKKIGPVRSIRRYMLDFIAEYDSPVILHEGGASFNDSDSVYVRQTDAFQDLRNFRYKSMQTASSRYRDPQKALKSGYVHSLYTSYDLISKSFEMIKGYRGWKNTSNIEELPWKSDDDLSSRGNFYKVDISFLSYSDNYWRSSFIYNRENNTYDRSIAGVKDIDKNNNLQISPKNVIIEWHNYRLAHDGYSRIIIDMMGKGEVSILRDGKKISGTWSKKGRIKRTRYYDANGSEISLNRGQIWKIIVVKSGNHRYSTVKYKYENTK